MGVNRLEAAAGVLVLIVLLACGGAATTPETSADAKKIEIGKGDPPPGFKQMQTLEVKHGDGCGAYGEKGTFDGAYAMLRNEAARIKADYVQMMTVTEPYSDGNCAHNEYKITAVAYRKGKSKKVKVKEDDVEETPKAEAKACVPGATQECLGPGACKGAQACRDDGSGYSACDCGNASTGSAQ
jgi:hypothetical protein